jgi:hypothetical protein
MQPNPFYVKINTFFCRGKKVDQKSGLLLLFKNKLPKETNHTTSENCPNLVTLIAMKKKPSSIGTLGDIAITFNVIELP